MRLSVFMESNGIDDNEMAALLSKERIAGGRLPIHRSTVTRYRLLTLIPRWDDMTLIFRVSRGAVAPNDWLDPSLAELAANRNQPDA